MSKKFDSDPAVQVYVGRKVDAALKAERKRIATAVSGIVPTFGSKREASALMKTIKGAVTAPAASDNAA